MFEPVSNKIDFKSVEESILQFWDENQIFAKSLDSRKSCPEFVFYDGPPFATGLPHYGHLLAGTIKDVIPRYQTMRGHYVDRRFGWDCHGLPVEYEVEQDLEISGKSDIEKIGVDVFNEHCRSIVLRYTSEWRNVVTRMGRWVDFDNDYKTMDPAYMESIWWVFKSLWDKDLIYEGQKILPYCPRCSTPLSNFETNQGYHDVTDPAITVKFKVIGTENEHLLAWTTTPWTLPSNMALAVGPDIDYVKVRVDDQVYILAQARLDAVMRPVKDFEVLETVKGRALSNAAYQPLFSYFDDYRAKGAFKVITADFVSTEDGTGIVHIAPGFGEDDAAAGRANGIPSVCPIDSECCFDASVSDYTGQPVKSADSAIIQDLKSRSLLFNRGTINHSYPHCWRCDQALIYRGISTWFVKVEEIKDKLLKANAQVHWVPEHLQSGRFGKWLEGARDWAISRNRYWGTPLPIWKSDDGQEICCVGSIEELAALSGRSISDLHKHHIDNVEIPSQQGKGMLKRIPEVLDCWFESGAMPYAQNHYPFENKTRFETHFPADFIAEGLDQTRGWFYTLTVLAAALFDRPAFKHVVVNGLVLAEDGKKMSKRLKNYPDPMEMVNTYGADALRLYLVDSPVVRAESLRFSEKGLQQEMRHILIPLWNAYSFFVTYANIDNWSPTSVADGFHADGNALDRWVLSSLQSLIADVTQSMDQYNLQKAVQPFVSFIDQLTNWYIRRSRRRFWKSQDDLDKASAYHTLYEVLIQLSKVAAPFIPFMSEAIYQNLKTQNMPESVHLCDFPVVTNEHQDLELERQMATVMRIVRMGRQLRTDHNLKVRQPLALLHIVSSDTVALQDAELNASIIEEELNVKSLTFGSDETSLVELKAKADFRTLGPRFGRDVKQVANMIGKMDTKDISNMLQQGELSVALDDNCIQLTEKDIVIERIPKSGMVVSSENEIIVALNTELNEELLKEGLVREFISKVQNLRKSMDLEVTSRIRLTVGCDDEIVSDALLSFEAIIKSEVLATTLRMGDTDPSIRHEEIELNDYKCDLQIEVV